MSEDKNWDWLQKIFENGRLRDRIHKLAQEGTRTQLIAMIEAGESNASKLPIVNESKVLRDESEQI